MQWFDTAEVVTNVGVPPAHSTPDTVIVNPPVTFSTKTMFQTDTSPTTPPPARVIVVLALTVRRKSSLSVVRVAVYAEPVLATVYGDPRIAPRVARCTSSSTAHRPTS